MGKELANWKAAKANAAKTIGKKGKLPKEKSDLVALMEAANKVAVKIRGERDTMETSVLALQDAFSKVYDAAETYTDIVDASTFNLDEDNKDEAKNITDAKKTLTDVLKEICDGVGTFHTNLETFNKHLANFEKELKAAPAT
ncbi:MAG TPA: hypothetical protein VLI93_18420 [Acetobacteraceae bacterium]|nr:hypothetical protein [Acetobacteraceae bacterium]